MGLGYGDEGKGTVVDSLVRTYNASCVIRYNGGGQAGHRVVAPDGRSHVFSQFGSGTFVPNVKTFLGKHMLVNPLTMIVENNVLKTQKIEDAFKRMYIDGRALVTTPYHRATNRLREMAREDNPHGSCGMGIGETVQDFLERGDQTLRVHDLLDDAILKDKLRKTRNAMLVKVKTFGLKKLTEEVCHELSTFAVPGGSIVEKYKDFRSLPTILDQEQVHDFLLAQRTGIFEGAQGVMLDECYGFHPYTTWSTTTSERARQILQEFTIDGDVTEVGIIRVHHTRHGQGPFPTESEAVRNAVLGDHNVDNRWQHKFRVGWLDMVALNYALQVNGGVDVLAVTHVDKLSLLKEWKIGTSYGFTPEPEQTLGEQAALGERIKKAIVSYDTVDAKNVVEWIREHAHTPVALTSHGPASGDKKYKGQKVYA